MILPPQPGHRPPSMEPLVKYLSAIAGILLGALFVLVSLMVLLHLAPQPKLEPGSLPALFMGAMGPSGYLIMVKLFELIGGVLVAIPKTRRLGLLILGPIIINILAYHIFLAHGEDMAIPLVVAALALFLLWAERRSFIAFVRGA
jgi:putative oxidoreductase